MHLIAVSKSLHVDLNNSADNLTKTHIRPLRRKKSLKPGSMDVILLMLITVVKVLLTDPMTNKRCRRCLLTITCSDETKKKGGKGGQKVANIPPIHRCQLQTASTGRKTEIIFSINRDYFMESAGVRYLRTSC